MFVVCSHFNSKGLPIVDCVNSIRNLYKNEKIVVVDTGSGTEYLNNIEHKDIDLLYTGPNYELGAWKKALLEYDEPYYVCIQDSVSIINPIDHFFNTDFASYYIALNAINFMPYDTANLVYQALHNYKIPYKNIHGLFGSMFIISNKTRNQLIQTSFFREFIPKNKIDSFLCERVLYCLFESLGHNVLESGINGTLEGRGAYFNKVWYRRE